MNMLAGIYFPDEGEILVDGKPVTIASPKDAFDNGIGMIHQHFKLVDVFTAAENIVLGLEDEGKLDLKAASARITDICQKYGFVIDPGKKVYDMSDFRASSSLSMPETSSLMVFVTVLGRIHPLGANV